MTLDPPVPTLSANANIARHLASMAAARPHDVAIKVPRGRTSVGDIDYLALSFLELEAEVAAWHRRLTAAGVKRGDRVLVMVRQGLPLIAAVFALFVIGAVPVVIDPGMGMKSFLACVARSRPRALVGIPLAILMSRLFFRAFGSVGARVAASSDLTARLTSARSSSPDQRSLEAATASSSDLAAILFTSGSTGVPKGVCYEHGMFEAQVHTIRETYGIAPGEIDLPLLPIFALFNPALGLTTIVPELDPRRPAEIDPARIVQAIQQENVTTSFGSPTLWRKIAEHCVNHHITLPTLRRVLCAGAPVPADLWRKSRVFLPRGTLHSPYGATEALPVASVAADEIDLGSVRGACVGRPVGSADVRIIAISDEPVRAFATTRELGVGEVGEIVVRGPMVTKQYDAQPEATERAKISDPGISTLKDQAGESGVWHRMGDCGYFDANGRLWFCGRKVERVETSHATLHTEPCEQVFRAHPRVARCALIGLGERPDQRAAIVVEATSLDSRACRAFARELRELAQSQPHTQPIKVFFFHPKFPVDVRHNAKIHRLTLARWAGTAKGYESDPKR
jgi:acyl-CoA synthetase (AMP-forming)/AMP-acid ligase II